MIPNLGSKIFSHTDLIFYILLKYSNRLHFGQRVNYYNPLNKYIEVKLSKN